jgi:hypothetical protein
MRSEEFTIPAIVRVVCHLRVQMLTEAHVFDLDATLAQKLEHTTHKVGERLVANHLLLQRLTQREHGGVVARCGLCVGRLL